MIDEKKLIEDLLNHDGMNFVVKLHDFTPEGIGCFLREYTDKLKEGFVDLINAQPKILFGVDLAQQEGWISVRDRYPGQQAEYLCRCVLCDCDDMAFYMVLRYIVYDKNPHFQHETTGGMKVSLWMPLPKPPKDGET